MTGFLRAAAEAVPSGMLARCLAHSLPVARFGGEPRGTELRVAVQDHVAAARDRRQELSQRRYGGAALVANEAVAMSPDVRRALLAGRVDLRVETVLAVLAQRDAFRINAVHRDPAEFRAGMPARAVDLRSVNPAVFDSVLAGLSGDYRPATITRPAPGTERLVWALRTEPLPVLK